MTAARRLLSIWLVPAEPERAALGQRIDELACRYDAPRFAPHITLFAGTTARADWREALAQAVQGVAALPAQVVGVGHSDQLWKTVFLQVASSAALLALQRSVVAALHDPDDYAFDPHLSLIYKLLPEAARVELAREVAPPSTFLCNALSGVIPSPGGWADVAGWQVQDSVSLPRPQRG
jgi:putative hydrolase of the HAD superfamily